MSLRKQLYYAIKSRSGSNSPHIFEEILKCYRTGIPVNTSDSCLSKMLMHCQSNVPYYRSILQKLDTTTLRANPQSVLQTVPVLTREQLASQFDSLKSDDLDKRTWKINTSGGSTGEPVRLVQDNLYRASASANTLLYSALCGKQPGDCEVKLWGSERDIFENGMGWKANLQNWIVNTVFMNAFRMTPEKMREYIDKLNRLKPQLILAYAQAIYELAQFVEDNNLLVTPQKAVMTSAGTLFPFMRQTIERVFGCRVYNRYGSREVGDIACQLPASAGLGEILWVAPWGCYVEVVDDNGNLLPLGEEGNLLVTSLVNFAMPLLRYKIGDRGSLCGPVSGAPVGQIIERVSGRVTDNFRTREGRIVPGEYFIHLIGVVLNSNSVRKFQIVQHDYETISVKIIPTNGKFDSAEIEDKIQLVMGRNCRVNTRFVDEIPATPSGKYRYTISEIDTSS